MSDGVAALLGDTHRLIVFERVARERSFTAAAAALSISQPAVSRHVSTLERRLGITLFERHHGGVAVTDAGETLLRSVEPALHQLGMVVDELRGHADRLVVAVQPAIAESWFTPRLDQLRDAVAPSRVQLVIFDREDELASVPHHASIRFDPRVAGTMRTAPLVSETVFPVAAPDLATSLSLDADSDPGRLKHSARLLQASDRGRLWLNWRGWFEARGVAWTDADADEIVHHTYAILLQQALAGTGIALGWDTLLGDLVKRGMLERVGPAVHRPDHGYPLVWRADLGRDTGVGRLLDWTRATARGLSAFESTAHLPEATAH